MGPNNSEHVGGGIKLFGTTISVEKSAIKKEQIKVDDDDDDDDSEDDDRDRSAEMKRVIACPRCKSVETKFCYFNNYNVNQPRHFCKGCQRYWTAGGALRNVPVGAGRRKPKPPFHGALFFHDWSSSSFPLPINKRRRTDASPGGH